MKQSVVVKVNKKASEKTNYLYVFCCMTTKAMCGILKGTDSGSEAKCCGTNHNMIIWFLIHNILDRTFEFIIPTR